MTATYGITRGMRKPPAGVFPAEGRPVGGFAVSTNEFRPPKKGELYLSGAIVTAYLASNDLTNSFWIAKRVEMTKCLHCNGTGKVVTP